MNPQDEPNPGTPPQPETPAPQTEPQAPQPAPEAPTPETNPAPEQPAAPSAPVSDNGEWPGAFGIFKRASAVVKVNVWTVLTFNLLTLVFSGLDRDRKYPVLTLVGYLISIWAQLALISLYLAGAKQETQDFSAAAAVGLKRYVDGFITSVVSGVLIALSILALVVPFFFVVPRLVMALYYVVDKDMGPMDAIQASWHDSKGFSGKVWGVIGVVFLFALLCVVLVGIYFLFMYQAAMTLLYLYIQRKRANQPAVADVPVASA